MLSDLELESYKIEYETTDISMVELCDRYGVQQRQLRGSNKWHKQYPAKITKQEALDTEIVSDSDDLQTMKDKITGLKKLAIAQCETFFSDEAQFAGVKEFKDIVSIIDTLDKSLSKTADSTPSTVVLIQNIMNTIADDC